MISSVKHMSWNLLFLIISLSVFMPLALSVDTKPCEISNWKSDERLYRSYNGIMQNFTGGYRQQNSPSFGEVIHTLPGYNPVTSLSISFDGTMLASGTTDSDVRLWNATTGLSMPRLSGHSKGITSVVFSPDRTLLASGSKDTTVKVWNIAREVYNELFTLTEHTSEVTSVTFSPDGTILATASLDAAIKLWNVSTGKVIHTLSNHTAAVNSLAFSPSGKILASASDDQNVKLWNVETKTEIKTFMNHKAPVKLVAFAPSGDTIVSAGNNRLCMIWDVMSGEVLTNLTCESFVKSVCFSPDGTILSLGYSDSTIKMWNVTTGVELQYFNLNDHDKEITSLVYSPDGTVLISGSVDADIKLWNVVCGVKQKRKEFEGHTNCVTSVAFSKDGKLLVSSSRDGTFKLWNITDGSKYRNPFTHTAVVNCVDFSPDGKMIAFGGSDAEVRIWNVTSEEEIVNLNFTGHTGQITSVRFSPDGKTLVSSSWDGTIKLWNVSNGLELHSLNNHSEIVNSVIYLRSGALLVSGSADETVRVWDTITGELLQTLDGHIAGAGSLSYYENKLAVCCGEGRIKIWNLTEGVEPLSYYKTLSDCDTGPISVAFSSNANILASGSLNIDKSVSLWNISSGKEIQSFRGKLSGATSVTISSDGKWLAAGFEYPDNHVFLWDIDPIPMDLDADGMLDYWERDYSLNPSNFWDKFEDKDNDGLMNILEFHLRSNPLQIDSDNDKMSDSWEYLHNLDPTIQDGNIDLDGDGMTNLYEYQMDLDPNKNDGSQDMDKDGLTNFQEFQFGSWANKPDSDDDGIPDLWEYQMGLLPLINDANDDVDKDGMPNYWEFVNQFNGADPSDAFEDVDGDLVSNLDEFKYGTDPHNFWSVPLLSFNFFHLIFCISLIITGFGVFAGLYYRDKQRNTIICKLNAPDYTTALRIQAAGIQDYSAYLQIEGESIALMEKADIFYYQGDYRSAIELHEKAITSFKRLGLDCLLAESIFRYARIQNERNLLTTRSLVLQNFPKMPHNDPQVIAFDFMLNALLAEVERDQGLADKAWKAALAFETLGIRFQTICKGALVESEYQKWSSNPSTYPQERLLPLLNEWEEGCRSHNQYISLCRVSLIRARVAFATFNFDQAEMWLNQCSRIANENKLNLYQSIVQKEKIIFSRQKERISAFFESQKMLSPIEQQLLLNKYIKDALHTLEKGSV